MNRNETRMWRSQTSTKRAGGSMRTSAPGSVHVPYRSTVPTATKSRHSSLQAERHDHRDELAGRSMPRLATAIPASKRSHRAARKTNPIGHSHGEPVGGRYYIKDGVLRKIESDEDSDADSRDDNERLQEHLRPVRSARKLVSSADETLARKTGQPARMAARKIDIIYVSSDSEETPSASDSEEDYSELIVALGSLTVPTRLRKHKCLPFLLRNLRLGFFTHCESIGIRTVPKDAPKRPVRLVYRYHLPSTADHDSESVDDDDWEEREGEISDWSCPMCDLHGSMNTRDMLVYHLQQDHKEIEAIWTKLDEQWQVTITLDRVQEDGMMPSDNEGPLAMTFNSTLSLEPDMSVSGAGPAITAASSESVVHLDSEIEYITPVVQPAAPPTIIPHKHELDEKVDDMTIPARESTPVRDPLCSGITEDGALIPPPRDKRLGPAAQYPYLRGDDISCRIGGPRLYDLLNELPLDEFGVLSWSIVDREEELFELDLQDEDKVMLALWNRWIMLNRVQFVFNGYLNGVLGFIDKYYEMIHRAAGWNALRMFLIMLKANRLLSLTDISAALKHYENKVGMEDWYKE